MTAKDLRKLIDSLTDDIEFSYNGIDGSICPFSRENISVSYGKEEKTFSSIDEVMQTPFIAGKAIEAICSDFKVY